MDASASSVLHEAGATAAKKIRHKVREMQQVKGKKTGGVWGLVSCPCRRKKEKTVAGGADSGEKLERPVGMRERETRGEWERGGRATYRSKNGRE